MIPVISTPPPQPAQTVLVQTLASSSRQAPVDPRGPGQRTSPLNRRGRRFLESLMRRRERQEFRRDRQLRLEDLAANARNVRNVRNVDIVDIEETPRRTIRQKIVDVLF